MNLPPVANAPRTIVSGRHLMRLAWRAWDALALYLPMVLMGLLALATYWMVRNAPELPEFQDRQPQPREVDFSMRGAVISTYDSQGRLQNQLTGQEMRHYADSATIEVDRPRWQSTTLEGRSTRAWAQHALSKDDGSEVQLLGQAVVVREAFTPARGKPLPMQEFRGEFLHIFGDDERMLSHLPVEFSSGGDRYTADAFRYDHVERVVELEGRVKAHIEASPARQAPPTRR